MITQTFLVSSVSKELLLLLTPILVPCKVDDVHLTYSGFGHGSLRSDADSAPGANLREVICVVPGFMAQRTDYGRSGGVFQSLHPIPCTRPLGGHTPLSP